MKILKLTHTITWKGGGAFFRAYHQGRILAEKGHDVTVMTISPHNRFKFKSFNIGKVKYIESPDLFFGKGRTGWDIYDVLRRIIYLIGTDFNIVHSYESRPVSIFPTLFLKNKSKIIIDWCDWYGRGGTSIERGKILGKVMEPIETFFEENFHKYSNGTIVMGPKLYQRAINLNIDNNKIISLLHGCDTEGIKLQDKTEIRKKYGIKNNDKIIGYLGQMRNSTAKLLFNALEILINQGLNYSIYLIGNHKIKNIDRFLTDPIRKHVITTGWLSSESLNDYLSICDICVLPFKKITSTNNIWPSKLNDYLSAGKPTLCTDLDIVKDIFNKYDIGLIVDDDTQSISIGIQKLLNKDNLKRISENCRKLALNQLNWNNVVNNLEEFYYKILNT